MTMHNPQHIFPVPVEAALGGGLILTPFWVGLLADLNLILSFVAVTFGVIIGAHSIYRIVKRYWAPAQPLVT